MALLKAQGSAAGTDFGAQQQDETAQPPKPAHLDQSSEPKRGGAAVLRMQLVGANLTPQVIGQDVLRGKVNYILGNDPKQWCTNIPTYGKVRYKAIYPGIDRMSLSPKHIEYILRRS